MKVDARLRWPGSLRDETMACVTPRKGGESRASRERSLGARTRDIDGFFMKSTLGIFGTPVSVFLLNY